MRIFANMITQLFISALVAIASQFVGTTVTSVLGTKETKDNLVLKVNTEGNVKTVSLGGYSVLNYDNISITGVVVVDEKGNILEFRDAKITGAPSKVKTVTGVLSEDRADIVLTGKAAGIVGFEVHYVGK